MKVFVFEAATLVGEADVYALDPGMGVAIAKFQPAPAYTVTRHANVVEGEYLGDRSDILSAELEDGTALVCGAIVIQDYSSIDEREVDFLGIIEPSFSTLFAEDPYYKAYYEGSA